MMSMVVDDVDDIEGVMTKNKRREQKT